MSTAMKNILTMPSSRRLLLLRLVHLRLLRGGLAQGRARQPDCRRPRNSRRLLPEHRSLGRADRPEPPGSRQRGLLPRLPPVLVDDGIDHVGRAHRARAPLCVPDPGGDAGVGRLDHGRRVGLEPGGWLTARWLPTTRSRRSSSMCRRRLHIRSPAQPRAAHRQVHGRGGRADLRGHNTHLTLMGLMLIFTGFYGFYAPAS